MTDPKLTQGVDRRDIVNARMMSASRVVGLDQVVVKDFIDAGLSQIDIHSLASRGSSVTWRGPY